MARLVVASPEPDCVASRALAAERLSYDILPCRGEEDYGRHLAQLWRSGQTFILVEHDIAPWPGAVQDLLNCRESWCAFPYPQSYGRCVALGCVKFEGSLISDRPDLPSAWEGAAWRSVDGKMLHALRQTLPGWPEEVPGPHEHRPPVAHVKES